MVTHTDIFYFLFLKKNVEGKTCAFDNLLIGVPQHNIVETQVC